MDWLKKLTFLKTVVKIVLSPRQLPFKISNIVKIVKIAVLEIRYKHIKVKKVLFIQFSALLWKMKLQNFNPIRWSKVGGHF